MSDRDEDEGEDDFPRFRGRGRDPPLNASLYTGRSVASASVLTTHSIAFRSFTANGLQEFQNRTIEFLDDADGTTELPEGSRIALAGADTSFPMAFDNDRFFGPEGYKDLLRQAYEAMARLSKNNTSWGAPAPEMGWLGQLWRWFVKFLMWMTNDAVNRLRFTRGIQDNVPFQTAYESYCLGGVIRAFDVDSRQHDKFNLDLAFANRNTSRVLVQNLGPRWDWVWHSATAVTWSRLFDFIGLFPFIGFTSFPATENFPSSRNHALRGIFRLIYEGSWITRWFTGNQQGIVTFDSRTAAQNLIAQSIGFEVANRNQYGTYLGREKTNKWRADHRLATDESVIRTFQTNPAGTMIDNGVEHVLRCLAGHWRNMLYQENGNFAHQRMEQLDPFDTLRFHMPLVLSTLANLRGRNIWDTLVLGPFMKKLQYLNPEKVRVQKPAGDEEQAQSDKDEIYAPCRAAQRLVTELKDRIMPNVCGGIHSRMEPFGRWLDAMYDALDELRKEAEAVKDFVASVDTGINLGYQMLKLVDWHVPTESRMKKAIVDFILDKPATYHDMPREVINSTLQKLAAKDMRTLIELTKQGFGDVDAGKLLLGRTCTLLERELRRKTLDDRITELAKGRPTTPAALAFNKWYWVQTEIGLRSHVFKGRFGSTVRFTDAETNIETVFDKETLQVREYIPIAEAISRAQKVFMVIELDHGKKFSYNCFMEFGSTENITSLRSRLRRLNVLAQVHCPVLDQARLNVLSEIRSSVDQMRLSARYAATRLIDNCKPQNVTVVGGGPTGLLAGIHSVQNVLLTGGEVKIYEGRDAFAQEGSSFERAQIVRLDPRQIAMVRYHLGTGYEDVFIPAQGETDAHMGSTLPSQGFVELTIKRMESMVLDEVVNMRAKDLLSYYTDSKIQYDVANGIFTKKGDALKIGDDFYDEDELLKVTDFKYLTAAKPDELVPGQDYDIKLPRETKVRKFRLVQKDEDYDWYQFESRETGVRPVAGSYKNLPPVYMGGKGRTTPSSVVVESDGVERDVPYDEMATKPFRLDFSRTHVIVASGKPAGSPAHFYITTAEPYAVCCIEGIKISMGMHNFGEKRWGKGLLDDIRSHSDQNTRVIGDFTKSVELMAIVVRMRKKLNEEAAWQSHFERLAVSVGDAVPSLLKVLLSQMESLCDIHFVRERLQTRFFETGNNYYLGMEFPREYDKWKKETTELAAPTKNPNSPDEQKKIRTNLQKAVFHNIDRLWYEACLEIIAEGDVYNPGGRSTIPQLYTIDWPFEQKLGDLKEQESFRLFKKTFIVVSHDGKGYTTVKEDTAHDKTISIPTKTYVADIAIKEKPRKTLGELAAGERFEPVDTFEVVAKRGSSTIIRNNSGGYIAVMSNTVPVGRISDLSRAPDGYSESKVALSAFPVAHVIAHRTLEINRVHGKGGEDGFITAFVGDAQASPHFMRYSGLTGAIINAMSVNNLVGQALQGVGFEDRIQRYAFETTWSTGEVVQRGTAANYGGGFLRPGFPYRKGIDYLYDRCLENFEMGADPEFWISRDWKIKIASSLVPRGLELDGLFFESLIKQLAINLHSKFEDEVKRTTGNSSLSASLKNAVATEMDSLIRTWHGESVFDLPSSNGLSNGDNVAVEKVGYMIRCTILALKQILDYSVELRIGNNRIASESFKQPKPVDSIVDDFAVEAQNFANALTLIAAFTATTIALRLVDGSSMDKGANIASGVLGVWSIAIAFETMTNVARYRNRNEEARLLFVDKKKANTMKAIFSLMTQDQRDRVPIQHNPYMEALEKSVKTFLDYCVYYDQPEELISQFKTAYNSYKTSGRSQGDTLAFIRRLVQEFIADKFHVNSYLQSYLVQVYTALDDILVLSKQNRAAGVNGAEKLFDMMLKLGPALDASIERGDIKFGFLKSHAWYQTCIPVTLKYMFGWMFCNYTIESKTLAVLKQAEAVERESPKNSAIKRPVRDLKELYYATKESEVTSMIFLSSAISFFFGIFFSFFRLIEFAGIDDEWVRDVLSAGAWASLGTMLGSAQAISHFFRKLHHLFSLFSGLGGMKSDKRVRTVRIVTLTQIFLVVVRLVAVVGATVALPWVAASESFDFSSDIPILISASAVLAAVFATLFFFLVEFGIRYNLDPQLGFAVCEPFRERIDQTRKLFGNAGVVGESAVPTQELDREAWEYTARSFLHEYRFDTVFAADRFGTILQHLQSGNKTKES